MSKDSSEEIEKKIGKQQEEKSELLVSAVNDRGYNNAASLCRILRENA